jgi:ABC-type antimicrobial peptide transport system permease subunit
VPPQTFAPDSQMPALGPGMTVMVHANLAPEAVTAAVKARIPKAHPGTIVAVTNYQRWIRDLMLRERLMAMLAGFFGVLAALLTIVGLYGVISYIVAGRTNEIGIRVALGATRLQVIGMVMGDAALLVAAGLAAGLALVLAAGRSASSLLFELKPHDPATLGAACLALAAITALASYLPARTASRVDPSAALRCE